MQSNGNFRLNQNRYNFEKFIKTCDNKKICQPHYSKLETGGNNPNQTKAMRYSEYVSTNRGKKIVNQQIVSLHLNSIRITDYTANSVTFEIGRAHV